MVIVNGKKFACSACIKGHRSSSCAHTSRTLVEIGRKGRPPTQCTHCRELRRTSKVHSKCMCGDRPPPARQLEILPNGTTSSLESSSSDAQSDTTQLINQSFNPCSCSIGNPCCCSTPAHPTVGTRANNPKKQNIKSLASTPVTSNQQLIGPSTIQSTSRPSCCSVNSTYSGASASCAPPVTLSSATSSTPTSSRTSYLDKDSLPLPSTAAHVPRHPSPSTSALSPSNPENFDPSTFSTEPTLFAPQTAGTALCFCGIHCPCPGCALHDPLGLKFRIDSNTLCPTSMIIAQDCIAGLDLPTVNQLLNLTPLTETYAKPGSLSTSNGSDPPVVNLPSVSQTFGMPPLSTSSEVSISQKGSYLMMGPSSNSAAFGIASSGKSSSFGSDIFQTSCCGSSSKTNVRDPSTNLGPLSHERCCTAGATQDDNPPGQVDFLSYERRDLGQKLETLNEFDLSGCCNRRQINSPPPG